MIKIMSIFGTRPEAIKMAPIIKEMEHYKNEIESIICVTAQHREMLDSVLDTFHIRPDYDLNIMKKGQTLNSITGTILQGLDPVLNKENPDMILVHGDTTTTFASALAAFYHKIPIGHVEAGLRTHNLYSPYPEEANRQMVSNIAELHFTPTMSSLKNLLQENKDPEKIFVTGNTAIDALKTTVKEEYDSPVLQWAGDSRIYDEKLIEIRSDGIYRSLHYIIKYKGYYVEIQGRTLFEEGWSEVDHDIVYPYNKNNVMLKDFSTLLNRLSGMADEMSSYFRRMTEQNIREENIAADYTQRPDGE